MAYFIPSYFQKRLLRYALTRLDFVETDDLDLDNLGLTFGQRSVIELKNVSIKISRIAERVQLPACITIQSASIKYLRLTIPADLHASGIQVEVDGVDILTRIHNEYAAKEKDSSKKRTHSVPSHTDRANRPRLSSPPVHDPGGSGRSIHQALELSRVLPTSGDLAASFLQSEPLEERQELEAAIGSQSHMHESTASAAYGDEAGLGMPAGFTLPAFVASFFQGVADRLSVRVNHVCLVVDLALTASPPEESARLVLKVGAVDIGSSSTAVGDSVSPLTDRIVSIQDASFGIETDSDMWSQTSSPKMSRTQSHFSGSSFDGSGSRRSYLVSEHRSLVGSQHGGESSPDQDSDASSIEFQPSVGLGIGDSISSGAELGAPTASDDRLQTRAQSSGFSSSYDIDNKAHAEEETLPVPSMPSSPETSRSGQHGRGLSESTLFTHEDAQSMYMSAVSQGTTRQTRSRVMPGGWEWSHEAHEQEAMDLAVPEANPEVPTPESPSQEPPTGHSAVNDNITAQVEESRHSSQSGDTRPPSTSIAPPPAAFIQLVQIDQIRITLPHQAQDAASGQRLDQRVLSTSPRSPLTTDPTPSVSARDRPPGSTRSQLDSAKEQSPGLGIEIGTLVVDLDLQVSKLAVRIAQTLIKVLSPTSAAETKDKHSAPASTIPALEIKKLQINFRESLSPPRRALSDSSDDPILSLSILSVLLIAESPSDKRLTVAKISLRHISKEVMWFIDSVNVRDSIASSSMPRSHDLIAVIDHERIDIRIKPVYVILDLIRIDDVLSRSGGLSSLLDLGNSIVSTRTVRAASPSLTKTKPSARSVRFNAPHQRPRATSDPSSIGSKMDVRLSGSIINLVGSEASIQVKTAAIKGAVRSGNVRIAIDGAAIEGPILPRSKSAAGVYAKLKSLSVDYFASPKDEHLDQLIDLITPSGDKYDDDDDIIVDTLLCQRRKGGVLSLDLKEIHVGIQGIQWQQHFSKLSEELAKLSTVAKYLPEDDRPGVLAFALVQKLDVHFHVDDIFGALNMRANLAQAAYINTPSLAAGKIDTWSLKRAKDDILIGEVLAQELGAPMVMCRFIADEMEPTIRVKLANNCVEYKVPTLLALTDLVARLQRATQSKEQTSPRRLSPTSSNSSDTSNLSRKIKISVSFRHSAVALHPIGIPAKGLFVLSDAVFGYEAPKKVSKLTIALNRASLLVINNTEVLGADKNTNHKLYFDQNSQIQELAKAGFVPVATLQAATAVVKVSEDEIDHEPHIDVEVGKNLLILETCADSTQTMFQVLGGLAPAAPPSKVEKYRTEIVPIQDMLASFSGNAFVSEPGPELGLQASQVTASTALNREDDEEDDDDDEEEEEEEEEDDGGFMNDMYLDGGEADDEMTASYVESDIAQSIASSLHIAPVDATAPEQDEMAQSMMVHSMLDFRTEHFAPKSTVGGTAHRWDSTKNTYELASDTAFRRSPLKVRIREAHVIWNMFDGYDWQSTRDSISQAVKDIEAKAISKRSRARASSPIDDEEEESVIGDVLFNSIYISIPAKQDPAELARAINHDIDDQVSETSYATRTTVTASPSRRQSYRRTPTLRLNRSKQHKMTIELQGLCADVVAFPPGSGEVESSVDVRVRQLDIFDHVPTSTWKKFATYMHEAGEREVDTSQLHIELLNVKPVAELAASEMVLKVTVLPLRLHVDQDALDFLSRFFEFKDENASSGAPSSPPFLQRVEVNPIRLQLDYKPKNVDYASLRSGRTTEFMNFIVLDRSDMILRRVILYGVSGFDRMGLMLNNIWMPDVKQNQLPGVLAGLAPIRPLVDVGRGISELVSVPIREYQKDGRMVRAIQKGAVAFAKTTTTELVNLGAKLAIGTQNVLQNAEDMLVTSPQHEEDEEKKQISLYADQPVGIVQGLRGAYASLERDLLLARDAIVAVPGEVMAQASMKGAAGAVLKSSPTIILRPAMGVSKAAAQTLQGVANTLDRRNLRRIEDKYKRH